VPSPKLLYAAELCPFDEKEGDFTDGVVGARRWARLLDFICGVESSSSVSSGLTKDAFYRNLAASSQNELPRENVLFRVRIVDPSSDEVVVYRYFVHSRLGAGKARAQAVDPANRNMKLLPWVSASHGASACLCRQSGAPSCLRLSQSLSLSLSLSRCLFALFLSVYVRVSVRVRV
jgi:hypothetical protein